MQQELMVTNDSHREGELSGGGGGRWPGRAPSASGVDPSRASPLSVQTCTSGYDGLRLLFLSRVSARLPPGAASSHLFACMFSPAFPLLSCLFHALFRLLALIPVTSRALLSAPHDASLAWRAAAWEPDLAEKLRN